MKFRNMNSDERKDWIETFVGGVCGVAAIVAAIVEYMLGDHGAVAGMLKDVFGTAIVVVLLIMAMPKRMPKNLAKILEEKVEEWGKENAPMLFKVDGFVCAKEGKYTQGFALLQDPRKYLTLLDISEDSEDWHTYANYNSKQTGKFLDLPSYEQMVSGSFEIMFVLEQKHFKEKEGIKETVGNLIDAIKNRVDETKVKVNRVGNSEKFTLEFLSAIENKKDIEYFISVINYVLSLVKVIA